jgi:hypothetical protein
VGGAVSDQRDHRAARGRPCDGGHGGLAALAVRPGAPSVFRSERTLVVPAALLDDVVRLLACHAFARCNAAVVASDGNRMRGADRLSSATAPPCSRSRS